MSQFYASYACLNVVIIAIFAGLSFLKFNWILENLKENGVEHHVKAAKEQQQERGENWKDFDYFPSHRTNLWSLFKSLEG